MVIPADIVVKNWRKCNSHVRVHSKNYEFYCDFSAHEIHETNKKQLSYVDFFRVTNHRVIRLFFDSLIRSRIKIDLSKKSKLYHYWEPDFKSDSQSRIDQ